MFESLISGALGWFGGEQQNRRSADAAEQAQGFSAQQFATRYQTTVKDMQAAGLNPMLAYSQGGGSPPAGAMASVPSNSGAAAAQGYIAGKLNSAQVANVEADTANKKASADLIAGQAAQAWSSSGQANANIGQINATTDKIKQEIENMPKGEVNGYSVADWAKIILSKSAGLMEAQTGKAQQDTWTSEASMLQLRALVKKLAVETSLGNLDLKAASDFGNIGREAGQLKPIVDIIKSVIGSRR